MIYTDSQLICLVKNAPKELVKILISPNTDIKILISGTEILCSEITDESLILPVIRLLLKHVNALVREGAVIGIAAFYVNTKPPQDVIDRLNFISNNDPFNELRIYVKDLLGILNK